MALIKNIETLQDLFVHTLQDIYYAEQQITKALPKMISKATDPQLQQLAARHGFRPANSGSLAQELEDRGLDAPSDYVNSIDPPSYDRLEQLIDGVGQRYAGAPAPAVTESNSRSLVR